jgi:hypothetical protein
MVGQEKAFGVNKWTYGLLLMIKLLTDFELTTTRLLRLPSIFLPFLKKSDYVTEEKRYIEETNFNSMSILTKAQGVNKKIYSLKLNKK